MVSTLVILQYILKILITYRYISLLKVKLSKHILGLLDKFILGILYKILENNI